MASTTEQCRATPTRTRHPLLANIATPPRLWYHMAAMTRKDDSDVSQTGPGWDEMLTGGHRPLLRYRAVMRRVPSEPRCKICSNPFGGLGGKAIGLAGFKPSRKNPNLCSRCCDRLPPGGVLIDIGILFVDLRGSTALAETVGAQAFARTMSRFYHTATDVLLAHDALIDKLIGDEVMALFVPGIAGADYRRRTVEAGLALVRVMDDAARPAERLAAGVAVHGGPAFVGNVGPAGITDFTALGDTVNTAARLQAIAEPGDLIISEDLLQTVPALSVAGESRTVDLRGKSEPFACRVVRP